MEAETDSLYAGGRSYEFPFIGLRTQVRVEVWDNTVLITASRDTFNELRKAAFIHELAAEGFIPGCYQWFSEFDDWLAPPVCWVVDPTRWRPTVQTMRPKARRFITRIIGLAGLVIGILLSAVLLR
jgi:hypothetical protein